MTACLWYDEDFEADRAHQAIASGCTKEATHYSCCWARTPESKFNVCEEHKCRCKQPEAALPMPSATPDEWRWSRGGACKDEDIDAAQARERALRGPSAAEMRLFQAHCQGVVTNVWNRLCENDTEGAKQALRRFRWDPEIAPATDSSCEAHAFVATAEYRALRKVAEAARAVLREAFGPSRAIRELESALGALPTETPFTRKDGEP